MEDIIYSECYGPEYHGLKQIFNWFHDWNKCGIVLEWDVKRCIEKDNIAICEWYFSCNYNGRIDEFDGCTIAEFNDDMKITNLKEFQSKSQHFYPYGEE